MISLFFALTLSAAADDGLVVHLAMDEGTGTVARDASGNGNNAIITGATWTELRDGFALKFDGVDDFAECADAADLNLTEAVTIEAWVYHDELPQFKTSIVSKDPGYWLRTHTDGFLGFTDRCRTPPLVLSEFWHHMVGVFDGTSDAFYLDGALVWKVDTSEKGPLPDSKGHPLVMASNDSRGIFKGMIDDVRIYRRAITHEEVMSHYEAGRGTHENPLRVYTYPFNDQIVAQIDPAAWDKLPADSVIEVNLVERGNTKRLIKHVVESFPTNAPFEVDLRKERPAAGDYDIHVWPRQKKGPAAGRKLTAGFHWPKRPAWDGASGDTRVLNNFVTELVNRNPGRAREVRFTNPRNGWVFFATSAPVSDDDEIEVAISGSGGDGMVLHHASGGAPNQEAMRFLSKGSYVLRIKTRGSSRPDRLVVRAIPALGVAYLTHSTYPHAFHYGAYDWQFLEDHHLLENLNIVNVGTWEWSLTSNAAWRRQGKKIISNISKSWESAEALAKTWGDIIRHPLIDGTTIDEFHGGESGSYDAWIEAVRRIRADETFSKKMLYPYCGHLYGGDRSAAFGREIVKSDYRLMWERYISESPTRVSARRIIPASYGERLKLWEKAIPGVTSKMLMGPNLFTAASESTDAESGVNYFVFMDMIFHHLANDSNCWNLAGILPWGAPYADEEIFRWMGKLNRHYCIEGKTEMLTAGGDPAYRMDYELDHIDNGSFTDGLDGWTVLPGDKGTIDARTRLGLDHLMRHRLSAVQKDSFCWMKRDAYAPNRIVQKIRNLELGRLYSLRFYTRDFKDPQTRQELCIGAKVTPSEMISDKCFVQVHKSNNPKLGWLNFHRLVFRATASTARLEISDWILEPGRPFFSGGEEGHVYLGAPEGQETMITFVQIQPYLE
jgi:hypothetical protein